MKISRLVFASLWLFAGLSTASAQAITQTQRVLMAQATATSNSNACSQLRQPGFYWEIGTASGKIIDPNAGNAFGTVTLQPPDPHWVVPTRTTPMSLASASKWLYGAYFVQRFATVALTPRDYQFLTLSSGYHSLDTSCSDAATVDDCLALCSVINGRTVCNDDFSNDSGDFYYDGGHFEANAGSLNPASTTGTAGSLIYHSPHLGSDGKVALAQELQSYFTPGVTVLWLNFSQPLLAGGMYMAPADYIDNFLRPTISGGLKMTSYLGTHAVCTNTNDDAQGNPICPTAAYEPPSLAGFGASWHYSIGHWVEDDPNPAHGDDGAYSSDGSLGFYPWIWKARPPWNTHDWSQTLYGVVARDINLLAGATNPYQADVPESDLGWQSVLCGRAIRTAFLTGTPQ